LNIDEITSTMTGIQFITDEKGRKTAAVIDLKKHKALWEDIEDVLVSRSRRHEKRIPLDKVKADLIKSGKVHG
jgi:phage baseplate assembly protein W